MIKYAEMLRQALLAHPETVNSVQPKKDMPSPPYTPGNTYLHLALNGLWHPETEDVVRVLLDFGCDPNIQNDLGWTALHFACQIDTRNLRVVQLLLDHGADASILSRDGRSPLDLLGDGIDPAPEIAELLLGRK